MIFVIGSVNIDETPLFEKLPMPGTTKLIFGISIPGDGKGAIQAFAAANAGTITAMIRATGDEEAAGIAMGDLLAMGVNCRI